MITLTESSLHKRNIAHYGITTLKSTISFGLLQIAKPEVGELIMDPLCGSGAIPIEVIQSFFLFKYLYVFVFLSICPLLCMPFFYNSNKFFKISFSNNAEIEI